MNNEFILKFQPSDEGEGFGYVWRDDCKRFVPNSPLGSGSSSRERHQMAQEITLMVAKMMEGADLEFQPR